MSEEEIIFNGINGATGDYLLKTDMAQLGSAARQWSVGGRLLQDLRYRAEQEEEFAISPEYDPLQLSQAGWGVIFPADADEKDVNVIREALSELLAHREKQAGKRYKLYYEKGSGYRKGESKNDFVSRHGASVGPVNPNNVPYYLLIVGDPESIPYQFQYELDVDYAVGRIYFETLEEYARYARSVVEAETEDRVKLPRQAVFFSVANPDDRATQLSNELLVGPLARHVAEIVAERNLGWTTRFVPPEQAVKDKLGRLLGGDETPALLFTASHGMGWPLRHRYQPDFQGALLCQDWPGPRQWHDEIPWDYYFGSEDVGSDAGLLGLVAFHFACYGAGTPYWDDFAIATSAQRQAIAPRAFLSALPKRLLSHPRGGALAVIGHVERAWTYSFKWKEAGEQTEAFRAVIYSLLRGDPVGLAADHMNLRYASIATILSNELGELKYDPDRLDLSKLAFLWTANNDARGYAVIGDPAVRIPVAKKDEMSQQERPEINLTSLHTGQLPEVLAGERTPDEAPQPDITPSQPAAPVSDSRSQPGPAARPYTVLDGLVAMSQYTEEESFVLGLGDVRDTVKKVAESLTAALSNLAKELAEFTEEVTSLDVETYVAEDLDAIIDTKNPSRYGAVKRVSTRLSLDGDVQVIVPREAGELDETLWQIHTEMVEQAQANRAAMIKVAADVLANLLSPAKPAS
ncbi:MAG TPA: hypothetical protein VF177_00930 [Anaerolineae bacterium]